MGRVNQAPSSQLREHKASDYFCPNQLRCWHKKIHMNAYHVGSNKHVFIAHIEQCVVRHAPRTQMQVHSWAPALNVGERWKALKELWSPGTDARSAGGHVCFSRPIGQLVDRMSNEQTSVTLLLRKCCSVV